MYFLWGQHNRGAKDNDGRFRPRPKMGMPQPAESTYREWSFHLVHHKSGAAVTRSTYHVGIDDPHGNRIAYLRDFPSMETATRAAREWVDERIRKIERLNTTRVPTPHTKQETHENQEK